MGGRVAYGPAVTVMSEKNCLVRTKVPLGCPKTHDLWCFVGLE